MATRLAGHLGMGAALGLIFGFCLVRFNIAHIGEIIANAANPNEALTAFLGSLILPFAFGAALTGFVLIAVDEAKG